MLYIMVTGNAKDYLRTEGGINILDAFFVNQQNVEMLHTKV